MSRLLVKYNSKTDQQLIKDFQETENIEALTVLYQRYIAQIYGVCLKYLKNNIEAEDCSMEIFELLIKRIKGKDIISFGAWLYTVVKNHCIEKLRREQRKIYKKKEANFMYSQQVFHPDDIDNEEEMKKLVDCMELLNVNQKQCVDFFYFKKLNYDEIANKLNIKWNQVRSNIQNGRRNLRNCLEK